MVTLQMRWVEAAALVLSLAILFLKMRYDRKGLNEEMKP